MAEIQPMPQIEIDREVLIGWGRTWLSGEFGFERKESMDFGVVWDDAFGKALAEMLGVQVVTPSSSSLTPAKADCVEVGTARVIGGIRPQNYDVAYRPDGPRIVFDSKTLNRADSIKKNWQNMINDLASEAATVHTRFPYCVVAFLVVLPQPAVQEVQRRAISTTLNRLGSRKDELDQPHLAEAISLVIWNPETGEIEPAHPDSPDIHLSTMHTRLQRHYKDRYEHLPPHTT